MLAHLKIEANVVPYLVFVEGLRHQNQTPWAFLTFLRQTALPALRAEMIVGTSAAENRRHNFAHLTWQSRNFLISWSAEVGPSLHTNRVRVHMLLQDFWPVCTPNALRVNLWILGNIRGIGSSAMLAPCLPTHDTLLPSSSSALFQPRR